MYLSELTPSSPVDIFVLNDKGEQWELSSPKCSFVNLDDSQFSKEYAPVPFVRDSN